MNLDPNYNPKMRHSTEPSPPPQRPYSIPSDKFCAKISQTPPLILTSYCYLKQLQLRLATWRLFFFRNDRISILPIPPKPSVQTPSFLLPFNSSHQYRNRPQSKREPTARPIHAVPLPTKSRDPECMPPSPCSSKQNKYSVGPAPEEPDAWRSSQGSSFFFDSQYKVE